MPQTASTNSNLDTLWYTRCPVPTAASLAIDLGLLDEEFAADGITIQSLQASGEQTVRESHFDHTQDNSFRQGGNIPPIWTRARGGDMRLIGLTWVDEYAAIITLPGSGIEGVEDLSGRRLGMGCRINDQIDFFKAMALRTIQAALSTEAMTESDVDLIEIPVNETYVGTENKSHSGTLWSGGRRARRQQQEAFALIRGEVDAIYTSGAMGANLAGFLGAHEVIEIGHHPDRALRHNNQTPAALTVSGTLTDERPDLAARFVGCIVKAAGWAETHHREVRRTVADDVGTASEWIDAAHGTEFHTHLMPGLDEACMNGIQSQIDFLHEHGFIEDEFDALQWIDRRPLEANGLA